MELVTEPVPAKGRFIPADAVVVTGVVGALSPEPIPMVLLPGHEYHITEWVDEQGERHWILERRVAAPTNRAYVQLPDDGSWLDEPRDGAGDLPTSSS